MKRFYQEVGSKMKWHRLLFFNIAILLITYGIGIFSTIDILDMKLHLATLITLTVVNTYIISVVTVAYSKFVKVSDNLRGLFYYRVACDMVDGTECSWSSTVPTKTALSMKEWCKVSCTGKFFFIDNKHVMFKNKRDAVLFKLAFA